MLIFVLVKRSTTLAIYFLQQRADSVTKDMEKEFGHITQWLKDVVAGKASLGVSSPAPTESPGAGGVRYDTQPRIFSRDEPL